MSRARWGFVKADLVRLRSGSSSDPDCRFVRSQNSTSIKGLHWPLDKDSPVDPVQTAASASDKELSRITSHAVRTEPMPVRGQTAWRPISATVLHLLPFVLLATVSKRPIDRTGTTHDKIAHGVRGTGRSGRCSKLFLFSLYF